VFESPDSLLSNSEFDLIAGTYLACDYVKQLWEELRKSLRNEKKTMHPALERKGLVFFAVGELLRLTYAQEDWELDHDLSKLAKPNDWLAGSVGNQRKAFAKSFEIASMVLKQRYDNKKDSDAGFKHRNWFRDEETLKEIRKGLEMALVFGHAPKIWG
jgi:hypothetical protein